MARRITFTAGHAALPRHLLSFWPILVRLSWSADWKDRHPWSFQGKPLPYIGAHAREKSGNARVRSVWVGPLSISAGFLDQKAPAKALSR